MKAMIFAAGLGTRLRPLTNNKPKALVKVNGKTLLEITIQKLITNGFDEIIINAHHFAKQVINYLEEQKYSARIEISDESEKLLDTGGGLKKAEWFFDDGKPFLVHNVDILTDLNLAELYKAHLNNNSIATLAARNRKSSRYFLFDEDKVLCGWENVKTGERIITKELDGLKQLAFSGVHVIDPKLFKYFPNKNVFSIVDVYLTASPKEKIIGYLHNSTVWHDVGKIEDLEKLKQIKLNQA